MTDLPDAYVDERLRTEGEKTTQPCEGPHDWESQRVCRACSLIEVFDPRGFEIFDGEWWDEA